MSENADRATFGQWLRQTREWRGLSMNALAQKAGVSHAHISNIEAGKASPHRNMVLRLAAALEVDPREATLAFAQESLPELTRERDPIDELPEDEQAIVRSYRGQKARIEQELMLRMATAQREADRAASIGGRRAQDDDGGTSTDAVIIVSEDPSRVGRLVRDVEAEAEGDGTESAPSSPASPAGSPAGGRPTHDRVSVSGHGVAGGGKSG